jgi:hypothetical protein
VPLTTAGDLGTFDRTASPFSSTDAWAVTAGYAQRSQHAIIERPGTGASSQQRFTDGGI